MLRTLIVGSPPPVSVVRSIQDTCKPLVEIMPQGYSIPLLQAIDRALALHMEDRPQSIDEFAALIEMPVAGINDVLTAKKPGTMLVPVEDEKPASLLDWRRYKIPGLVAAGVLVGVGTLSGLIGLCLKGGNTDMSTIVWIAAIVIFGVVEAATAGLTSIWFVLGSVAALIVAICNGPIWLQISLFFVVSIVTLAATRPLVAKLMKKDIKPTNADRVLGGLARVTERIDNDVPTGAVYIDGKTWSARSSSGESIEPDTMVRVVRMEGVKLYVEAEKEA